MMRLAAHMNIRKSYFVETELKSVYSMRNKDDRIDVLMIRKNSVRACLKNHSCNLHASICRKYSLNML